VALSSAIEAVCTRIETEDLAAWETRNPRAKTTLAIGSETPTNKQQDEHHMVLLAKTIFVPSPNLLSTC
jgi:hypothetical protein